MSVGRIIAGKYCLLQQLGQGAMGSVWAAEHLTLRSQVAVKLIQPQALAVPNIPHRFERGARALAALRSPHVVQILDYGIDSGVQYLVMELLNGETLRARLLRRSRLSAQELSIITRHVARAMTVSHAAGFVHRDLKPENVFLTSDGDELVAKVLDFGITKPFRADSVFAAVSAICSAPIVVPSEVARVPASAAGRPSKPSNSGYI